MLTKPKNALCKQYKQLFTASNTDFKTTPEALQEVAVAACKRNIGARGLRSILELLLQDALYEVNFLFSLPFFSRHLKQQVLKYLLLEVPSKGTQEWKGLCSFFNLFDAADAHLLCKMRSFEEIATTHFVKCGTCMSLIRVL